MAYSAFDAHDVSGPRDRAFTSLRAMRLCWIAAPRDYLSCSRMVLDANRFPLFVIMRAGRYRPEQTGTVMATHLAGATR